jgi:predicted tellurium resistance membrane protein TerC
MSVKDLVILLGGLFLIGKATWEIHHNLEGAAQGHHPVEADAPPAPGSTTGQVARATFGSVIFQILMLDLVFSIDSVLTAIGMVDPADYPQDMWHFPGTTIPWVPIVVMASAIIVAIGVMLLFVNPVSRFVENHPTMKMLALSFLVLIGVVLVAEAFHQAIPRGYIYSAMGFSLFVELLNLKFTKKKAKPQAQAGA